MKVFNKILLFLLIIIFLIIIFIYFKEKEKAQYELQQKVLMEEKKKAELILEEKRKISLQKGEELFIRYFYDEAINKLKEDPNIIDYRISEKINEYTIAKNELIKYEGPIEHIFFHSLILYPEYLFPDLNKIDTGYNAGFIYKRELDKILPKLLERDYVLYDIKELFKKNSFGVMEMQDIYLPIGKKPLILSIDDPSYHYKIGFAKKLILYNGKLMNEVITPDGDTILSYDGDVELVIENFIEKYPEFSYKGARGTIATTGFNGIFGYDLKTDFSKQSAKEVVEELKRKGWTFASHSYTHNRKNFFSNSSKVSNIKYDTKKWKEEIEPIVGNTNIFIAPFGYMLKGEGLEVILDNGFDIYCIVGISPKISVNDRYALMSRNEIGGYALFMYKKEINNRFFNPDEVIDTHRPPLE